MGGGMHQCFVWVLDEEVMMGKMAATSNLKQFTVFRILIYEIHGHPMVSLGFMLLQSLSLSPSLLLLLWL